MISNALFGNLPYAGTQHVIALSCLECTNIGLQYLSFFKVWLRSLIENVEYYYELAQKIIGK